MKNLIQMGQAAKTSAAMLNKCTTKDKNSALLNIAKELDSCGEKIIKSTNWIYRMLKKGISDVMLDRLSLTTNVIGGIY